MSTDVKLKHMGTQSRETLAMEAALAENVGRSTLEAADQAVGVPSATSEQIGRTATRVAEKVGEVADRALDLAKEKLRSAAGDARDRAAAAVASYTRDDPNRAVLIAAGVGALLMLVLSSMARSGARKARSGARRVEREVRRIGR